MSDTNNYKTTESREFQSHTGVDSEEQSTNHNTIYEKNINYLDISTDTWHRVLARDIPKHNVLVDFGCDKHEWVRECDAIGLICTDEEMQKIIGNSIEIEVVEPPIEPNVDLKVNISTEHIPKKEKWEFDSSVAEVFDDMIERSIPHYDFMRESVSKIIAMTAKPYTEVIDLGCSNGGAIADVVAKLPNVKFHGIEVSVPMRDIATKRFEFCPNVTISGMDLTTDFLKLPPHENSIRDTSVIVSNLTLQFVPIEYRQAIVQQVYDLLMPGGAFIFVEKVLGNTPKMQDMLVSLYHDMKGEHGYDQEKIAAKRKSLEGVLVPVCASWNEHMLRSAGFRHVDCFYRAYNFAGFVGIK